MRWICWLVFVSVPCWYWKPGPYHSYHWFLGFTYVALTITLILLLVLVTWQSCLSMSQKQEWMQYSCLWHCPSNILSFYPQRKNPSIDFLSESYRAKGIPLPWEKSELYTPKTSIEVLKQEQKKFEKKNLLKPKKKIPKKLKFRIWGCLCRRHCLCSVFSPPATDQNRDQGKFICKRRQRKVCLYF